MYPASAAGMFTANRVKAAPVLVSRRHLESGKTFRAIVANSGCANACTGRRGIRDAEGTCSAAAKLLGIAVPEVFVASTGVIGQALPAGKLKRGLARLAPLALSGRPGEKNAVEAIMTTDLVPKSAARELTIDGRKITVWGCAKGSGMIHPSLTSSREFHATMLAFVLTDANIAPQALNLALKRSAERTFNRVSVDGDTSTNDTVFVLANGAALNKRISGRDGNFARFERTLFSVCDDLAKQIARDGEGATKSVEIEVRNAGSENSAKRIAETVATSPLVKTAIFGGDANWGRVMAAAGRAGVKFDPGKVDVYFGPLRVAENGAAARYSEAKAKKILGAKDIKIMLDLHSGRGSSRYYTCDLSFGYIRINADYRS